MDNVASWIWVLIPLAAIGIAPFKMWIRVKERQIEAQTSLAAEKSALDAERLDVRHEFPQVAHVLGMLLARRGEYAGAAKRLHAYLEMAPNAPDAGDVRSRLAEVEKLSAASLGAKDGMKQ